MLSKQIEDLNQELKEKTDSFDQKYKETIDLNEIYEELNSSHIGLSDKIESIIKYCIKTILNGNFLKEKNMSKIESFDFTSFYLIDPKDIKNYAENKYANTNKIIEEINNSNLSDIELNSGLCVVAVAKYSSDFHYTQGIFSNWRKHAKADASGAFEGVLASWIPAIKAAVVAGPSGAPAAGVFVGTLATGAAFGAAVGTAKSLLN